VFAGSNTLREQAMITRVWRGWIGTDVDADA
jgi:hypothetical protein